MENISGRRTVLRACITIQCAKFPSLVPGPQSLGTRLDYPTGKRPCLLPNLCRSRVKDGTPGRHGWRPRDPLVAAVENGLTGEPCHRRQGGGPLGAVQSRQLGVIYRAAAEDVKKQDAVLDDPIVMVDALHHRIPTHDEIALCMLFELSEI